MTAIEALQALQEGKKIRDVTWPYGHYVEFRKKDGRMINRYGHLDSLTIENAQDLEGEYEIYTDCEQGSILTDDEKKILSQVTCHFRDKIAYIKKVSFNLTKSQNLCIQFVDGFEFAGLVSHDFKYGTKYVGMEDKPYTLKELGLDD